MPKTSDKIKTVTEFNKHSRRLKALLYALKYPNHLKQIVKQNISSFYEFGHYKTRALPSISPEKIINSNKQINLLNCSTRNGNVSYLELLIISAMTALACPKNLLEIGTFDGTTTLQIALNSPTRASVHTIDLPDEGMATKVSILKDDLQYVFDKDKRKRKYLNTPVENKVIQHFGDSSTYDFNHFCKQGLIDFCFIDGGHSYECVKSDTENTLSVLSPDGIILWHDYNPNCPGVYKYLNELESSLHLKHFMGTALVVYCKSIENISL